MSRVCISIAVSRPEGNLDPLPGAVNASRGIIGWATAAKFDKIESISDTEAGSEVTVADLKKMFMRIVGDTAELIEHLVVHFAGHGFTDQTDDQLLLLSKWYSQPTEAINVKRFARLLEYYQPQRVSLFLDACRSEKPASASELQGSGILDRPQDEPIEFLEDRFRPARAGKEAFMIRDLTGGPSHCLFSAVLLKALCGVYPEALEVRDVDRIVTSDGLYRALKVHLPIEAARYRLTLTPSLKPGFVPIDDVYTTLPISFVPPELPTPAEKSGDLGLRHAGIEDLEITNMATTDLLEKLKRSEKQALVQKYRSIYAQEERPTHFETGCGLAILGLNVVGEPVVSKPAQIQSDRMKDGTSWWRVSSKDSYDLRESASIVVELNSGVSVGAVVIPGMITSVSVVDGAEHASGSKSVSGATSVIYRTMQGYSPDGDRISKASEDIVVQLRAGTLSGEEALSAASKIRGMKHSNPILGVIAAYLYDAAGDRESIRRIAWFYPKNDQPIPFDVALLAGLTGRRRDGKIRIDLPRVAAREPRTDEESLHPEYFIQTTEEEDVLLAGGFPWMRQGWELIDIARIPVYPGVVKLASRVLPMPFTTLELGAGRLLAKLVNEGEV